MSRGSRAPCLTCRARSLTAGTSPHLRRQHVIERSIDDVMRVVRHHGKRDTDDHIQDLRVREPRGVECLERRGRNGAAMLDERPCELTQGPRACVRRRSPPADAVTEAFARHSLRSEDDGAAGAVSFDAPTVPIRR
jgi:hypothetical protein